ncbi:MAG: bifunctional tRNA (5-methylaminomethyl-2-thiouridine)(34)-methyltransferase MnmD/FAD-dependent 5-carboxymethylaminomethyl-2-thiouridine(34) oxidoreductase MnmC [Gammaproteobacteria bacterium]|jgi:tRNA 5-methylaminomethyl-2-thiouridine biosynthesis bifunctional protein
MKYAQIEWNNGTPYSPGFGDVYFSESSGVDESLHVFLQQNQLPKRWQQAERFVIAETGFGTGLNFIVTMKMWLQSVAEPACLHFISIEKHPVSPQDMLRLAEQWPELEPYYAELIQHYPPPLPGMHLLELAGGRVKLHLIFDDIEQALEQISLQVDAWYLDGFAPARNPAMWTDRVFELIARYTLVGGSFATYTASGAVRRGLTQAGFVVKKGEGFGRKRDMLSGFIFEQRCYRVDRPWFSLPDFACREKHVVIVGAGLAGLSTAWALVKRGWKITVLDRHADIAGGASGNPAGLLMPRISQHPSLDSRFYLNAFVYAVQCLDRLQSTTNDQFWFKTGSLLVEDAEKLQTMCGSHQFPGDFIRYINRDNAKCVSGVELNRDTLSLVDAGWVKVKRLCEALRRVCGDALTYTQTAVTDIRFNQGTWEIIDRENGTVLEAECVVIANGAGAKQFTSLRWLPVESVRGQLTVAAQTAASGHIKCAINAGRYITPAHRGRHVVGASYSAGDESKGLSATEQQDNIDGINDLVPALLDDQNQPAGRVAVRAVSRDRVPVAGCVPDREAFENDYHDLYHGKPSRHYPAGTYLPRLYVTTAHGSRGLSSCFIVGELIASMICQEPMPVGKDVVDYLNPGRFVIRQLKRARA